MAKLIRLESETDVRVMVAANTEWEERDPRIDATLALVFATERAGMQLFYSLGREDFYLQVGEHGTNIATDCANAILNAGLILDVIARHQADRQKLAAEEEKSLRVRLAQLTDRAIRIGNSLWKWDGESEVVYERRQSPKGLYLVGNAFDPHWQKRRPSSLTHAYQYCPRPFVFELPDDIDVLERFIIHDEELHAAWK